MNSPTNTPYKTRRRPVTPVVLENSDIPEIHRFPTTHRWDELDKAEAQVEKYQRIMDRITLVILLFGSFYLSFHLVLWAVR